MVWLFLSVLLLVGVFLAIYFPAFRKALRVCLAVLFIVVAGGAAWLYYTNVHEHQRAELSRLLFGLAKLLLTRCCANRTEVGGSKAT